MMTQSSTEVHEAVLAALYKANMDTRRFFPSTADIPARIPTAATKDALRDTNLPPQQ
jgi:hypothetical protein